MNATQQERVRAERLARTLLRDVASAWDDPLAGGVVHELSRDFDGLALMISGRSIRCLETLTRAMQDEARLIVLEPNAALARIVEGQVDPNRRAQTYVQRAEFDALIDMKPGTFDLIAAHLVFGEEIADWRNAVGASMELLTQGGRLIATMQGHASWRQIEDLLDEVLRQMKLREGRQALARLRRMRPGVRAVRHRLGEDLEEAKRNVLVSVRNQQIVFANARQMFASPVVTNGPLKLWRTALRELDAETQREIFWRLSKVLDAYHGTRPIGVDIELIQVTARRGGTPSASPVDQFWARFPSVEAATEKPKGGQTAANDDAEDDIDIDIDVDIDIDIDIDLDDDDHDAERAVAATSDEESQPSKRPKTAAQRLIDAQIIDEEDLVSEVLPEDYDPSHALADDLEESDSKDIIGEFSLDFPEDDL